MRYTARAHAQPRPRRRIERRLTPLRARGVLLLLGLVGCGTPPDGWLYATRVTSTSAVVAWTGFGATLGCRAAGERVPAEITRRWRGVSTAHLAGLGPGVRVRCRLVRPGGRRRTLSFRTAPRPGTRFRFALVGDSGDLSPESFALARRIRAGRPDFLLHVGDLAYPDGTLLQLHRRFFRPYGRVLERVPLYTTPGNHDYGSRSGYRMAFAPIAGGPRAGRAYAFEWAGAHFVAVPSPEAGAPDTAAWLARTLERIPPVAWRTVFLHEPPYSPGLKRVTPGIRARLSPILQAAHVDLLLAGHEHLYARSEPICDVVPDARLVEVISGGGGANLDPSAEGRRGNFPVVDSKTHYVRVTVTREALHLRAIGIDGTTLDRARVRREAGPPCRADGWPPAREHER